MIRLKVSRPRLSVPNGVSQLGPENGGATRISFGGCGATNGANTAANRTSRRNASATTAGLSRSSRPNARRHGFGVGVATTASSNAMPASSTIVGSRGRSSGNGSDSLVTTRALSG